MIVYMCYEKYFWRDVVDSFYPVCSACGMMIVVECLDNHHDKHLTVLFQNEDHFCRKNIKKFAFCVCHPLAFFYFTSAKKLNTCAGSEILIQVPPKFSQYIVFLFNEVL